MTKDFGDHRTLLWSAYCNIMCWSTVILSLGMKLRPGIPTFHSRCSRSVTTAHFVFPSGVFMHRVCFSEQSSCNLRKGQTKTFEVASLSLERQTGSSTRAGVIVAGEEQGQARAGEGRTAPQCLLSSCVGFFPAQLLQGPASNLTYLLPLPTVNIPKEVRLDLCFLGQPALGALLLGGAAITLRCNSPAVLFHSPYQPCVVYIPLYLSCLISFTA